MASGSMSTDQVKAEIKKLERSASMTQANSPIYSGRSGNGKKKGKAKRGF
jgi:hypothetical protein